MRPFHSDRLLLFFAACVVLASAAIAHGDDVEAARSRLKAIEEARQSVDLQPVPDKISERALPVITFDQAVSSQPQGYFAFFFKSFCGPCERMKNEKVPQTVKDAGYNVAEVNLDTDPQPTVTAAPEVWFCQPDGKPVLKFKGYHKAESLLQPVQTDGLCRLSANGSRWSGVAISDSLILTCAHHEQTEAFFAEFPRSFGGGEYAKISAELVKIDKASDLSVLRYSMPDLVQVSPYALSTLPESAIEVPGYLSGQTPKRVRLRPNKGSSFKIAGIALDSYDGEGISSPQFGMSGSPLLTPDKSIAGIQSVGSGREVGAIRLDTIRKFLANVDLDSSPAVNAIVENAELTPNTIAAVLAAHLAESAGPAPESAPAEEIAYGSLFAFEVDTPESWKAYAAKLLSAQKLEFASAGLRLDWSGSRRNFAVSANQIEIKPPIRATFSKWLITYSAGLDGFRYPADLSEITVLLTGAPDLTVRLK
jgi:hypothetical protein